MTFSLLFYYKLFTIAVMIEIQEQQKVKLVFGGVDGEEKVLHCSIKRLKGEQLYLTSFSSLEEYSEYLQEGEELNVTIYTPLGLKIFDSVILESPNDSCFAVEYVEDHEHVQRRSYVRAELCTKMVIEGGGKNGIQAQTVDIGGGGIKFLCYMIFENDEEVTATLYLPDGSQSIKFQGRIIKQPHLSLNQYVVAFNSINERDRDRLIKLCFEVQRNCIAT